MADADEATSALIAQMLNEQYQEAVMERGSDDEAGAQQYGPFDDSPSPRARRGGKVAAARKEAAERAKEERAALRAAKRAQKQAKKEAAAQARAEKAAARSAREAEGRATRKDAGKKRVAGRPWTDDEERLFREGLELHGRGTLA